MWLTLFALVAMAVADVLDALMTVAEARGQSWLAGALSAGDNTLALIVGIIGADTLIEHGVEQAVVLMVLVLITTFFSTSLATKWACKHVPD